MIAEGSLDPVIRLWKMTSRVNEKLAEGEQAIVAQEREEFLGRAGQQILQRSRSMRRRSKFEYFQTDLSDVEQIDTVKAQISEAGMGRPGQELRGHTAAIISVRFSPNGQTLASASHDGTLILWQVSSGEILKRITSSSSRPIWSCTYSADGSLLACGTGDGKVELWEPSTGLLLLSYQAHTDYVDSCTFSGDGLKLASGSASGMVRIWKILPADQLKECRKTEEAQWKPHRRQKQTGADRLSLASVDDLLRSPTPPSVQEYASDAGDQRAGLTMGEDINSRGSGPNDVLMDQHPSVDMAELLADTYVKQRQ